MCGLSSYGVLKSISAYVLQIKLTKDGNVLLREMVLHPRFPFSGDG